MVIANFTFGALPVTLSGVITTRRWLLSIRLGYRGTCILLYENYVMMIIDELFDFQICVLCCVVRINGEIIYHNIFCDNYWFILVI